MGVLTTTAAPNAAAAAAALAKVRMLALAWSVLHVLHCELRNRVGDESQPVACLPTTPSRS